MNTETDFAPLTVETVSPAMEAGIQTRLPEAIALSPQEDGIKSKSVYGEDNMGGSFRYTTY